MLSAGEEVAGPGPARNCHMPQLGPRTATSKTPSALRVVATLLIVTAVTVGGARSSQAEPCPAAATVVSAQGVVEVRTAGGAGSLCACTIPTVLAIRFAWDPIVVPT
jgi:hypothetical protein